MQLSTKSQKLINTCRDFTSFCDKGIKENDVIIFDLESKYEPILTLQDAHAASRSLIFCSGFAVPFAIAIASPGVIMCVIGALHCYDVSGRDLQYAKDLRRDNDYLKAAREKVLSIEARFEKEGETRVDDLLSETTMLIANT